MLIQRVQTTKPKGTNNQKLVMLLQRVQITKRLVMYKGYK